MTGANKKMVRGRLLGAYVSSVVSIALVLVMVALAAWMTINASRVSDYFKERVQISVLLRQGASDEDAVGLAESLSSLPFVRSTRVVTIEEGTRELAQMLGEDFLSVFEYSPVPVSVDVGLGADYVRPDSLEMARRIIASMPKVQEVSCQQSLVEALNANLTKISLILGIFILLMLFISYVLIGNTVRISLFDKRFSVFTMKLVGATGAFIRRPFMRRSLAQALVASALALSALGAALLYLRKAFPQMAALCDSSSILLVCGAVVATSIVVCELSTFFTVNKLVSMGKDELYY